MLPFQKRVTQTKPVPPLSNEYGSQVKVQGRWQCCHNKHKKFPHRSTCDVSLLYRHVSYVWIYSCSYGNNSEALLICFNKVMVLLMFFCLGYALHKPSVVSCVLCILCVPDNSVSKCSLFVQYMTFDMCYT